MPVNSCSVGDTSISCHLWHRLPIVPPREQNFRGHIPLSAAQARFIVFVKHGHSRYRSRL